MGWFNKGKGSSGLKKIFFPPEKNFYQMLADQASKTCEGMEALGQFVQNPTPQNAMHVMDIEQEADNLRRLLIEELHQSFVSPMDREDIFALSRTVDDMVDYANSTVEEMEIYEVAADEHLREMVEILGKEACEVAEAIRHLEKNPAIATEHAVQGKSYENMMETAYHSALADLFKKTDAVYMLKMREIYRHLSNAADRGDQAANIICSIVMKAF